ncbi:DUF2235 domain-containing protein [Paucibacter sp. R3-3]|uniref:DUF2235 domain-containing protein n=1 Tax=Roseateles agri TaxID=3098619 RepID=A0ABU5DFX1_9BURK|nr:DUF2235 domain-containing protein [Paucibacter sp. R3-3]MDY0744706.1 DUF2235 domain-containing protein [Paucibacter sp. R3-3]
MQDEKNSAHPQQQQLVLCFDGTNNTLTGGTQDTNVLRLHRHLSAHPAPEGWARLLYYDPGVGSPDSMPPTSLWDWAGRTRERLAGLASGRGIYDNVAQGYLFLMRHWRSDADQIYCFGFSRGAFTARAVAGMVNLFGLLEPQYEALLPTLVRIYFSQPPQPSPKKKKRSFATRLHRELGLVHADRDTLAAQVREQFAQARQPWVYGIGVWDTVESVGLPGPLSQSNPASATFVGKRMRHARHALALDEHRYAFLPRLYEEPGDVDSGGQTLKQRWFAGVHCDVGGGYPVHEAGLSDQAMAWMVDELGPELGIPPWTPEQAAPRRLRHDPLWDTPWWALAGMCLRDMRPHTSVGATPIAVVPAAVDHPPQASVWQQARSPWPALAALLLGLVFVLFSGACLLQDGGLLRLFSAGASGSGMGDAWRAGLSLVDQQLHGDADLLRRYGVGWAMFWDLCFIGCWGYLLARIASRGFAWLAPPRRPGDARPWWHALGMLPLIAVMADVIEDGLTLVGLALHGMDATLLGVVAVGLVAVASLLKFLALLGCLFWVALRLWIAMPWVKRWRSR